MNGLRDAFQRPIDYLRISVTDRCNLRCVYCMPAEGISWMPREAMLTYEEILAIVQAAAELGVTKLRLTGGEPLARADLPKLVAMLADVPGIDDIALTTNGLLLARYAQELKDAGLRRLNISLDTKDKDKFLHLSRRDRLDDVLEGIEAARRAGFWPLKLNMVVWRGVNDDEIVDFAHMTLDEEWHVRFIELMPFNEEGLSFDGQAESMDGFMSTKEVMEQVMTLGELVPCERPGPGNGPARYYRLSGGKGTVGFISPMTESHFCETCNKVRLTTDGKIRPCLLSDVEIDLMGALRRGATRQDLKRILSRTVSFVKPERHFLSEGIAPELRRYMVQIGG